MNASKFLVSSAAALAVVGAIGIANAQTDPAAPAAGTEAQMNQQTPPAAQTPGSTDSTLNNSSTPSDSSGDLTAQVDRN